MARETWGTIDEWDKDHRKVFRQPDLVPKEAGQKYMTAAAGSNDEFHEFLNKPYSKLTSGDKTRIRTKLIIQQDGKCAICGTAEKRLSKKLCIDHNHKTDKIRSLLCSKCNTMLGFALEDVDILASGIEYLEKHRQE